MLSGLNGLPEFESIVEAVRGGQMPCSVFGVPESLKAFLLARALNRLGRRAIVVTPDEAAAEAMCAALNVFGAKAVRVCGRELRLTGAAFKSRDMSRERIIALYEGREAVAVVASAEAVMAPLPPPEEFFSAAVSLKDKGEPHKLARKLMHMGYSRVPAAESPAQFAMRGGILDVYPVNSAPIRIEFFDDEIESIREYDPATQLSIKILDSATILPATEALLTREAAAKCSDVLAEHKSDIPLADQWIYDLERYGTFDTAEEFLTVGYGRAYSLFDYYPGHMAVFSEFAKIRERFDTSRAGFEQSFKAALDSGFAIPEQADSLVGFDELESLSGSALYLDALDSGGAKRPARKISVEAKSAPEYRLNLNELAKDVSRHVKQGYFCALFTGGEKKAGRLAGELASREVFAQAADGLPEYERARAFVSPLGLQSGFVWPAAGILAVGERDIYGTAVARKPAVKERLVSGISVFTELKKGDYVVHDNHGIGIYRGISQVKGEEGVKDYLVIEYAGGDRLFIPTDQIGRIQKYIGMDEKTPKVHKLGASDWNRAKQKARDSIRELAFDLAALYAARKETPGFAFSPDTPFQAEFEENFAFVETPDQLQSIAQIKRDMESSTVMDRLLCGDVGFGKTEVAMRAAFKAVMDSKQVAFLVPTTVLAQQHYNTLVKRFEGFPVRIDVLSRFKSASEQKKIIEKLKKGSIDIIVGTHRLLGKDVNFRDLGLLIIDEEQRFGVGHKETIKNLKKTVDVLTLTATPIPRTLHMSLSGIRDISVIETPPEDRFSVQTYIMEYSEEVVRSAVLSEIARGGQVYFVYNNVGDIDLFLLRLKKLLPEAKIAVAHGQMDETMLERVMVDFYEHRFDVLLCTTIIESGLDIPNVNTIIVYDADRLGLSQLYQLRGRVGRSYRLAYAYLTFRRDKVISEKAEKRLAALRDLTELGSGFKVAMKDLEIRGAGNLFGPQQHGHISEVGYEMYTRMLNEAVRGITEETPAEEREATIDVRIEANIPVKYISDDTLRLEAYREISDIKDDDGAKKVLAGLRDRYGKPPESVANLVSIALARAEAVKCFATHVSCKKGIALIRFAENAPFDTQKLVALIARYGKTLHFAQGTPPQMIIRARGIEPKELLPRVQKLLRELSDCIITGVKV